MKKPHRSAVLAFSLPLLAMLLGGCTSAQLTRVQPWQRGTLADYTMQPGRDPLGTVLTQHVYFSREAATGGPGVGGSGCGCN